jgi:hypothetical protein
MTDAESAGSNAATNAVVPVDKPRTYDPALEHLYQRYSVKQKRAGVQCFLAAAVLYDVYMLVLPGPGQDSMTRGLTAAFLGLNLALLAWTLRPYRLDALWAAVPYVAWFLSITQLLAHLFLRKQEGTGRDSLGWALLLDYLLYVTLPLRLPYCVLLSVATCTLYMVTLYGLAFKYDSYILGIMVRGVSLGLGRVPATSQQGEMIRRRCRINVKSTRIFHQNRRNIDDRRRINFPFLTWDTISISILH